MAIRRKRITALRSVIKRDEHQLATEKDDMTRALQLLRKHEQEMSSADDQLRDVESKMRECIGEDGTLSLTSLDRWRRYLPEVQRRHRQARETTSRSEVAVDQTTQAVTRRRAGIRAVEKVRDRLSAARRKEDDREAAKEIDATYLQRWRRPE